MTLAADIKSAFRNVRRGGWLSVTVVLILAVAIGAVSAIFSIAHAVLIRPLPVAEPDHVMLLWGRDDARSQQVVEVSLGDRRTWLASQRSFTAIGLFGSVNWGELHVTGPGRPFRAVQNAVSSEFFDVLGARPLIGGMTNTSITVVATPLMTHLLGQRIVDTRRCDPRPAVDNPCLVHLVLAEAVPLEQSGAEVSIDHTHGRIAQH